MDDLTKAVRKLVFDRFLETGSPPVLEEIMQKFKLDRKRASGALKELEAGRHIVLLRNTNRILMAHPFSSIATPFRVRRQNNRVYHANCAWDAIAFHTMLNEPVVVDSYCHHCGEKVSITLVNQKPLFMRPDGVIVYIGTPAARWWDDISNTCSNNMTFFSNMAHLHEWVATNPDKQGANLDICQTLQLSIPIYRDKMKADYKRPSKEELAAHFESLGLHGDFWKL